MRTNRSLSNLRGDIKYFLTQLKLSALQLELENQYGQPNMEGLSFERRLSEALRNVCEKRSEINFEKVMNQACVSPDVRHADFENFWPTAARKPFSSLVEQLQTYEWLIKEKPANLVIVGHSGAGKSWLASAFSRQACRLNLRVRFIGNTKQFLDELNTYQSEGSSSRYLSKFIKAQLLILDDILLNDLTNRECHWLHQIIQQRYQKRATIILSQKPTATWK